MNSRRKFLVQGTIATSALLAAKPFAAIAKASTPFINLNGSPNQFVLLHTAEVHSCTHAACIEHINRVGKINSNAVLLTAGKELNTDSGLQYEVTPEILNTASLSGSEYKIINKGTIKTGVIQANKEDVNLVENVNKLATWLKKEKGCHVVVCLSQLGYRKESGLSDTSLAASSRNLDIIIGGDPANCYIHPVVILNSEKAEVIIHSATSDKSSFGKIEIDFDKEGRKKFINIKNFYSKDLPAA